MRLKDHVGCQKTSRHLPRRSIKVAGIDGQIVAEFLLKLVLDLLHVLLLHLVLVLLRLNPLLDLLPVFVLHHAGLLAYQLQIGLRIAWLPRGVLSVNALDFLVQDL
jgi:hypothetical protein